MTARASRLAEQCGRGEPSPQCLADGYRDLVGRHAPGRDVDDRPGGRSEPDAVAADDLGVGARVRRGVDRHPRLGHEPPTLARDSQVDSVGDDVGQAEQLEGRLVRDDRPRPLPQPRGDDLLSRFRREVPQAVQPARHAYEAAGLRVVGQQRRAEAGSGSLFRGEVPGLPAGRLKERLLVGPNDSLVVHMLDHT